MASNKTYEGGCLCGHIRFRVEGEPDFPHTCSCTICRQHSGSLTVGWVEFERNKVNWIGDGGEPSLYRSSEGSSRAFCSQCGSSLGAVDDKPVIALLVGSFDKPNLQVFKPLSHSYRSVRPKWWHVEIK
jgi:hypothetical protein